MTKKFLPILLLFPLLLTGCSLKTNEVENDTKAFSLKQECFKYKEGIQKEFDNFNTKQQPQERADNDGSTRKCYENKELKEIFYSNKLNSCAQVEVQKTYCNTPDMKSYGVSYEYNILSNVLTGETLEYIKTISRGEGFETPQRTKEIIDSYR